MAHADNPTCKLGESPTLSFVHRKRHGPHCVCIAYSTSPPGTETDCRVSLCALDRKPQMHHKALLGKENCSVFKSILLVFLDCNSDCESWCAWVMNKEGIFTFYVDVRSSIAAMYIAAAWAKWISLSQSYCFSAGNTQWRPQESWSDLKGFSSGVNC